ncbi:MAG TPA: hydroxysqualene dehydroxylase HpnE [Thermomicrobiaceae bacterium]|nr:hydroxysqualene dehydroxylase HpnE [Thermomicrobiaceae bacterium]
MGTGHLAVAVVGGGLAGLSAARALTRQGYAVDLFERSRLLGGKATSFEIDGVEVDNGQHVYLACFTEFIDFVEQLGPLPDGGAPLYLQPRFDVLLLARSRAPARMRAARLPAPYHLAPALMRYRHLSLADRLRLALAVRAARRPAPPDETFAAWLRRQHQSEAARRAFWEPFLVPALNARPESVSAEAACFVIATAFLGDRGAARLGWSRVPLGRLAEQAAQPLNRVFRRRGVAALELASGPDGQSRPHLRALVAADGERIAYDGVVLALPPQALAHLLGEPERLGLSGLDRFQSAPIVDVHLWYDVAHLGFGFAALIDSPVQWVFEKAPGYLCCSLSAAEEQVLRPEAELIELCQRELAALLPPLAGRRPLRGAATREREATFIPAPGLRRPGPHTACPEVVIAGSWTDTGWPATMESAVRSGRAAAAALAANLADREAGGDG